MPRVMICDYCSIKGYLWPLLRPVPESRIVAGATRISDSAWQRFDAVAESAITGDEVWARDHRDALRFIPDFDVLRSLLAVPLDLGAGVQSGLPAKAVDVWVATELRRAGFGADEVWPRPSRPRVLPREVALLLDSLPRALRDQVAPRLEQGSAGGSVGADASVLGKAYYKQVDVVISQWARGPELLISTKRMDSSLSNNAFNRIEESYGDAHNLRGRYPMAAIGYLLVIRARALDESPAAAERLIDLVAKLGRDDAGYDATSVIVAEWDDPDASSTSESGYRVGLVPDRVPDELSAGTFFGQMVEAVLDRTPVDAHVTVRELRAGRSLSVSEDESR